MGLRAVAFSTSLDGPRTVVSGRAEFRREARLGYGRTDFRRGGGPTIFPPRQPQKWAGSMRTLNDVAPRPIPCTRTFSSNSEKTGRNVVADESPHHPLPREEA